MQPFKTPSPYTYWVIPGKLLAGEHPGSANVEIARKALHEILEAGVTVFIDLTEEPEFYPYEVLVKEEASRLNYDAKCYRFPIPDRHTPSPELMKQILDIVDSSLEGDDGVYLHCLGGIGRTGTVVGCYLVRHGLSGEAAVQKIAHLRRETASKNVISPETKEQHAMVLGWQTGM